MHFDTVLPLIPAAFLAMLTQEIHISLHFPGWNNTMTSQTVINDLPDIGLRVDE